MEEGQPDQEPKEGAQHAPNETPKAEAKHEAKKETNTVLAILAYIGPLIVVSYLLAKDDPFVKFHIKQGLLLVIGEVAIWMLMMVLWIFFPILQLANVFLFVLAVVGIIRAVNGEMKELPLVGHLAKNFNF